VTAKEKYVKTKYRLVGFEWFPPVSTPKGVPRRSAFQHWWSEAGCPRMVQPYWQIFLCRSFL